jgi:translation initiation factor 4A
MWQVIKSLGDFLKIKVHACVGGTAVREDITILMDGVHVVVGEF